MPTNKGGVEYARDLQKICSKLWDAADQLHANSNLNSSQYSTPVLGLIFFKFADSRFEKADDNCNLPTAEKLGLFIKNKATWIDISHLSYSKNIINKIPTLFVFISSIDKEDHPYMVIYQFNFPLDNLVTQFYGPFLNGGYHRISKVNDNDTLFIKYDSCMECHPWVYLQAIQFSAEKNIGVPLHFNYSLGEPFWSPKMEYELPGMGHSVGGSVETRITRTGSFSIIQKFSLYKDDKIEWWGFDCKSFRCKTDIRKNDLPKDWGNGWKTGKKI